MSASDEQFEKAAKSPSSRTLGEQPAFKEAREGQLISQAEKTFGYAPGTLPEDIRNLAIGKISASGPTDKAKDVVITGGDTVSNLAGASHTPATQKAKDELKK